MTVRTIKNHDGSTFHGCECIEAIWDELNAEARARGIVKSNFDVYQGSYNTSVKASAKTHFGGGVLDIAWVNLSDLNLIKAQYQLLDQFGFDPFRRGPRSYDSFDPHFHIVLRGCPHLHWQAANQNTSWLAGRDGLVRNWKDRDLSWRVSTGTWRDGLAWYKNKLAAQASAVRVVNAPALSFSQLQRDIASGKPSELVMRIQRQLNASGWSKKVKGYTLKINGIWDASTSNVYLHFQQAAFRTANRAVADGKPGKTSLSKLGAWRGTWKVTN